MARVGAALGNALGVAIKEQLPEGITPIDLSAIVHAACLAHDIGNPPFGHAGESAIKDWFCTDGREVLNSSALQDRYKEDLFHYEGNAQGFRIITQTENRLFEGGLQLTYATLGTFLKYPWLRSDNGKFSAYLSEATILETVATELGLIRRDGWIWCRHPLAYLVEAADDICWAIIDLEDAVELRLISFDEVFQILTTYLEPERRERIKTAFAPPDAYRVNLSRLRGALFDDLVSAANKAFSIGYDRIMSGSWDADLFSLLPEDDPYRRTVQIAKDVAIQKIYGDTKKVEIELGSSSIFACLLDAFCAAALRCSRHLHSPSTSTIDWKSKLVLRLLGDHSPLVAPPPTNAQWDDYQCIRRVLDFIGGMTDNYATYVAHQIQGVSISGVQRP